LRSGCAAIAQRVRSHCAAGEQTLRSGCAALRSFITQRYAVGAQPLRSETSVRNGCVFFITQSLRSQYAQGNLLMNESVIHTPKYAYAQELKVLRAADGILTVEKHPKPLFNRSGRVWTPTTACTQALYERQRESLNGTHVMQNALWGITGFDVQQCVSMFVCVCTCMYVLCICIY
jgi:hypothetical protein